MLKIATFVNGSHLFGAFKHLDLFVDDYEGLYGYLFEQSVMRWRSTIAAPAPPAAQHMRVYWYVVEDMDEWDLNNPRTRQHLQERFLDDRDLKARWMVEAARVLSGSTADQQRLEQTAFSLCFDDFRDWYEKRLNILGGMNRFYHAVEASSDFIEVRRCGRWKVDLLRKTITEKGVDVAFAVDMVGLQHHYDIALLVTSDTESIPSIEYLKSEGKQVAVIELLKGYPPEARARTFASPLKLAADFAVPVYEQELIKYGLATKGSGDAFALRENDISWRGANHG